MGHRRPADRTPVVHRQRRRGGLVRPSARHADAGRCAGAVPRDRPHGHLQPGLRGRRRREQPDGLAVHARGHGRRTRDRRAAPHDARGRPGEALPHLGAARPDAPRHAAGRRRCERQRDLPAARRRADVGRLRRDVRGPALQRPHGDRAVDRAGHVLPARPELQGRRRRRAGPAARRTAAARHHRRAHRHGRRQPARDHDDHGRAVPGRRDREARASRDRRIRTARVAGRRQHDDHRDLRLHRRAARPVRREGDQPRRQLGRRALPLPRGARHRARGHDRCRRSAGDPRGRPGDIFRRAAEHLEPRRAVHVLRGRRAAAPPEPDRLRAALPRVLHERPRRTGRRCRRPERRRAVGAHGVDRQHDRPARDRGLHLRSRGRRIRRLQLQCHDLPGPEGTPRPCVRGLPLEDGRVLPGPRRHARRRRSGHRQLVGSREGQGGRGRARTRCRDGPDRLRRDVQRERGRAGQVRDPVHPVPLPRVRGCHDDDARRVRRLPVAARARPPHGRPRIGRGARIARRARGGRAELGRPVPRCTGRRRTAASRRRDAADPHAAAHRQPDVGDRRRPAVRARRVRDPFGRRPRRLLRTGPHALRPRPEPHGRHRVLGLPRERLLRGRGAGAGDPDARAARSRTVDTDALRGLPGLRAVDGLRPARRRPAARVPDQRARAGRRRRIRRARLHALPHGPDRRQRPARVDHRSADVRHGRLAAGRAGAAVHDQFRERDRVVALRERGPGHDAARRRPRRTQLRAGRHPHRRHHDRRARGPFAVPGRVRFRGDARLHPARECRHRSLPGATRGDVADPGDRSAHRRTPAGHHARPAEAERRAGRRRRLRVVHGAGEQRGRDGQHDRRVGARAVRHAGTGRHAHARADGRRCRAGHDAHREPHRHDRQLFGRLDVRR